MKMPKQAYYGIRCVLGSLKGHVDRVMWLMYVDVLHPSRPVMCGFVQARCIHSLSMRRHDKYGEFCIGLAVAASSGG